MTARIRVLAAAAALLASAPAARAAYSPATTNGWFIVVGRVVGLGGAQFRTDVWLFNPDPINFATVTLTFHPQAADGAPAPAPIASAPITLGNRETKLLADLLLSTLPADDQVGALEWTSSLPIMGGMRSYTAPSGCTGGSFGAFLPAVPATESMTAKQSPTDSANVLQMFGTSSGDLNYRTQIDVTNTSAVALPIEVKVIDPVNAIQYVIATYTIAPKSLLRVGRILESQSVAVKDGLRVTVGVKEGTNVPSGGILAVASTLDNRSQDQYAFVGQRQSGTVVPAELLAVEDVP
jgi:hypothetical protein